MVSVREYSIHQMHLMETKSIASRYNDAKWMLYDSDSHNTLKCWHIIPAIVRAAQGT